MASIYSFFKSTFWVVVFLELWNIPFVGVAGCSVAFIIEATDFWSQVRDEPRLHHPPYHPDLVPAQRLASAMSIYTLIYAVLLLIVFPIFVNARPRLIKHAIAVRCLGHLIVIACLIPAAVMQSRYMLRPLNQDSCTRSRRWPPSSGVSSRYPTMFELIHDVKRKGGSRSDSCDRLVVIFWVEIVIAIILAISICLSFALLLHPTKAKDWAPGEKETQENVEYQELEAERRQPREPLRPRSF